VALKVARAACSVDDYPEVLLLERLASNQGRTGEQQQEEEEEEQEEGREHICFPLGRFNIDGPNGTHFCFIYPVLGPSVSYEVFQAEKDLEQTLRHLCREVAAGMRYLHRKGICHGGKK